MAATPSRRDQARSPAPSRSNRISFTSSLVKQGSASLRKRRALLADHQRRVQAMIAKWTEALALVDAKIEFYDEWVAGGTRPTVSPQQRARAKRSATTD